ncbi:MAG: hypothetical protein Q4A92_04025 [Corynebacterium sp.]|nr:hypothetical protein [Corynebacterium sp.]
MAQQGIVPVSLELTEGTFYTLWAPLWKEHGQEWQAFLGYGDHVYLFSSPAELLVFLESGAKHDLTTHPKWGAFQQGDATRVVPTERNDVSFVEVPAYLAGRPSHSNVGKVARAFALARSLGSVCSITEVESLFSGHSILGNVERGHDHFGGEHGLNEWSAIGRVILTNWDKAVDALDTVVHTPEIAVDNKDEAVADAKDRIKAAQEAAEAAAAEKAKAEEEAADPYDTSIWAAAGIDPVKIAIDGRTLYTLRTYLGKQPLFLGKFGQIVTFNNRKAMARWLAEHDDHDLATVSTWPTIMDAVNGGDLDVIVHDDNTYVFTGLREDIAKGPKEVDTDQLRQAYELLADSADWAADDSVNSVLVANPALQEYIAYMLGSATGYVPSAPFTAEVDGWKQLEDSLIARFTKF